MDKPDKKWVEMFNNLSPERRWGGMMKQNRKLMRLVNKKAKLSRSGKTLKNPREVKKYVCRLVASGKFQPIPSGNITLRI